MPIARLKDDEQVWLKMVNVERPIALSQLTPVGRQFLAKNFRLSKVRHWTDAKSGLPKHGWDIDKQAKDCHHLGFVMVVLVTAAAVLWRRCH